MGKRKGQVKKGKKDGEWSIVMGKLMARKGKMKHMYRFGDGGRGGKGSEGMGRGTGDGEGGEREERKVKRVGKEKRR